jgi:hypothetical protein
MQNRIQRDNEMRVEIVDGAGQRLPIAQQGIAVHVLKGSQRKRMLVNSAGKVTNLPQIGLAGSDGERMVLTLRREDNGSFTVLGYRQLFDS